MIPRSNGTATVVSADLQEICYDTLGFLAEIFYEPRIKLPGKGQSPSSMLPPTASSSNITECFSSCATFLLVHEGALVPYRYFVSNLAVDPFRLNSLAGAFAGCRCTSQTAQRPRCSTVAVNGPRPKNRGFSFPIICRTFRVGDAGFEPATSAV